MTTVDGRIQNLIEGDGYFVGHATADFSDRPGARAYDVIQQWDRRHVAAGSVYVGSWHGVAGHLTKSISVLSTMGGSLHWVVGMSGSNASGFTGTAYSQDLASGSMGLFSSQESFRYLRTVIAVGSVGSGKGTLSVAIGRQT